MQRRFSGAAFPGHRFDRSEMGVFWWCGADLPRRSPQFHCHVPEGRQKRERLRQVQDYTPH